MNQGQGIQGQGVQGLVAPSGGINQDQVAQLHQAAQAAQASAQGIEESMQKALQSAKPVPFVEGLWKSVKDSNEADRAKVGAAMAQLNTAGQFAPVAAINQARASKWGSALELFLGVGCVLICGQIAYQKATDYWAPESME